MNDDEPTYELVMPFVVVTSAGGPYDDLAFHAGWVASSVDNFFAEHGTPEPASMHRDDPLLPQLDLIAMKHGHTMTVTPAEDDGWVVVSYGPHKATP